MREANSGDKRRQRQKERRTTVSANANGAKSPRGGNKQGRTRSFLGSMGVGRGQSPSSPHAASGSGNNPLGAQQERPPVEEGWFVNTVDSIGRAVTGVIYSTYAVNKPTLVRDAKGIKLGDERFYDDVKFGFATDHYIRKGIILLITNPAYKLLFNLLTILHTASLMVQEAAVRNATDSTDDSIGWAVVVDRFLIFFYGIDLAMGLVAHGAQRFFLNFFRIVDVFVFAAMVGLEVATGEAVVYFLAFNSLRPFRMVSRIRTMRNIVTVVARTSTTLGDVLILCGFLVGVFGVFSLTVFGPAQRSRCYTPAAYREAVEAEAADSNWTSLTPLVLETLAGRNTSWIEGSGNFSLTEFYSEIPEEISDDPYSTFCRVGHEHDGIDGPYTPCEDHEVCVARAPSAYTWGGFDNMAAAMLTVIQVMTLENWSQVAQDVLDTCTLGSGLFFLTLTMIGSFWAMNLVLATITKSCETFYEEDKLLEAEEERDRERARLANEQRKSIFLPFVTTQKAAAGASDTEDAEAILTEGLLQQHRSMLLTSMGRFGDSDDGNDGEGGGPSQQRSSALFPNWDAGSDDVRTHSPSAHRLSRMPDARRQYVLDLERGALGGGGGANGNAAADGSLNGSAAGDVAAGASPSADGKGLFGKGLGGRVRGRLGIGRSTSPRDGSAKAGPSAAPTVPPPSATSPPETNPYLANPFLRSRWRNMAKAMSRQSVASMAYLSVPLEKITEGVVDERRRQRERAFSTGASWAAAGSPIEPHQRQAADKGGGEGDEGASETSSLFSPRLNLHRRSFRRPDANNPFYRLRVDGVGGYTDHTRGIDEVLREAAGGIRGTTYVVRDGDTDGEEMGDMNALAMGSSGDGLRQEWSYTFDHPTGPYSPPHSPAAAGRRNSDSQRRATRYTVGAAIDLSSEDSSSDNGGERHGLRRSTQRRHSLMHSAMLPDESIRKRSAKKGPRFEDSESPDRGGSASLLLPSTASVSIPQSPLGASRAMTNTFSAVPRASSPTGRRRRSPPLHSANASLALYDPILPELGPTDSASGPIASMGISITVASPSSPRGSPHSPVRSALNTKGRGGRRPSGGSDEDRQAPRKSVRIGDATAFFAAEHPSDSDEDAAKQQQRSAKSSAAKPSSLSTMAVSFGISNGGIGEGGDGYGAPPSEGDNSAHSFSEVEAASMRLHTYYDDRLFDAERVRRQFRDYVPRPVYDPSTAKGLLRLSVDTDAARQRAFDANNSNYKHIIEWRAAIDFDELCAADHRAWDVEALSGGPIPQTAVDATAIVLGDVAASDSLDGDDDDDDNDNDDRESRANGDSSHGGGGGRKGGPKRRRRANGSHGSTSTSSSSGGSEEVSSLDTISSRAHVRPINLHAKAEKIAHIHAQYVEQAMTLLAERRAKLGRQVAKGLTAALTEEDFADERRLHAIQQDAKGREERWAQHALRQPKDRILARISRRRKGSFPTQEQIANAIQGMSEVDPRDGGLFAKITLTAQLRSEIKFLEVFIAKGLARKTNSAHDMTTQRVRREARRGFKIHERRAKTLKGNLLLVMLGDWYGRACKGAVLLNAALLLFVHYGQPLWLTIVIEALSYVVDVLLIFDCAVRVWLWSPRKYFALTTSHFFAFVEHAVVWLAFVDLFSLLWPAVRVVRVFRIFRFLSSYNAARRIVKTVQSSIRHLLHIVGFLAIFMVTFTVGGWQIFSSADISSGFLSCRSLLEQSACNEADACVWVTEEQWLTLTNIEYDQMKTSFAEWQEAEEERRENSSAECAEYGNCSSISRTIVFTEPSSPSFCRQYKGWNDVDAGERFNFGTLFTSFSTVFTVVTKDAWTDVAYNYMENVTPYCAPFFLCILFIGGFVLVPLLVAILLVNFEENNEKDAGEERDAALLDEVRRQLSNLGPESQAIAEQLRLREEKERERKRLRELEEATKAAAKAAKAAASEEARRKDLALRREEASAREAKMARQDEASRQQTNGSIFEGASARSGSTSASGGGTFFGALWADIRSSVNSVRKSFRKARAFVRSTAAFAAVRVVTRYVASFCDRRDTMPAPILGRSLLLFPANSGLRVLCCDIVAGRYIPFELITFWVSMVHCVVTPMIDESIDSDGFLTAARVVNALCVFSSAVDMLIRCTAQCGLLGNYAFARTSYQNKADFIAVIFSLIAAVPEIFVDLIPSSAAPYLWAFSCLRPLRIVVRSSSVMKVIEAIWFTVPDMLSVIGVFGGATLIFAVVGVEQLSGMLKTCQDGSDRSEAECTGYWVATSEDDVYLPPGTNGLLLERAWKNPRQANFDNCYSAIATLMEICVASQWGEVLFNIIDSPPVIGGAPARNQSQGRSFYLYFWLVVSNFGLMNIFVGTIVNAFSKYQSMQSESFFGTETAESRAVRSILSGTTAKKRLAPSATAPFISAKLNRACAALVRRPWWRPFMQFVLVANCAMMLTVHYDQPKAFEAAQFAASSAFGLVYLIEMIIKMCIAGPTAYLRLGFNKIQCLVVVLGIIEVIMYAAYQNFEDVRWFRVSWTVRVIALAKENPSVRRLMRVGARSLPAMANIGSLLLLLFYIFSIWGIAFFGNVRIVPAGRDSFNQNINFRTFPRAMFTLYRVATLDDWGDIVAFSGPSEPFCSKALGTCGNRTIARFFFTLFVVSIAFVMLNLFIAVVLENFEISELIPDTLREREEDVQRFRQAWGKMATGNHLKIHAKDFVPLLKELPGPRARLQMLKAKQADDPDFNMSEEEMNFMAKKYAFGLNGEETQTYIKSLVNLNVPIIMPTQEVLFKDALDVISRLLFNDYLSSDSAQDIGTAVMAQRPPEYSDGFTVAHHYCRTRIVTLLKTRKGTKMQYPKWSRFLDPIFREIYERNSMAVIGGGGGGAGGGDAAGAASSAGDGGKGGKAISTKTYSLADYLREALRNAKGTEDDDLRWKGAIREAVSEGSSDEDSEGSDCCLPEEARPRTKDGAAKAREAIRAKMQLTGETYFGGRVMAGGTAVAADGCERFMPLEDRMLLLQGRQEDGAQLSLRRDRETGATSQLPPLSEIIARRARSRAKAEAAMGSGGAARFAASVAGGSGSPLMSASAAAASLALAKSRLRRVDPTESIPAYLWRRQIGYDNNAAATGGGRKGGPAMSFFAAVTEATKRAKAAKTDAASTTSKGSAGGGYTSSLSPELKARIRSALLRFAKDYKASRQDEALAMRPSHMAAGDATDAAIRMPTLDDLIRSRRQERGLPPEDATAMVRQRTHLLMTAEERAAAMGQYGARIDDVRMGPPGSAFGHKAATSLSVPLPFREGGGAFGQATPSSDAARGGGMSASSAASSRSAWAGGTTRGSRRKQQAVVIAPGSTQHALDRLIGILALKKFARRWRERAAARKTERERAARATQPPDGGGDASGGEA